MQPNLVELLLGESHEQRAGSLWVINSSNVIMTRLTLLLSGFMNKQFFQSQARLKALASHFFFFMIDTGMPDVGNITVLERLQEGLTLKHRTWVFRSLLSVCPMTWQDLPPAPPHVFKNVIKSL